ncbi:T-cell receptor alpha chain V region HPB-MLT [Sciurus carolinensis]|nr:T-cell receptor alpha chain V region HPB-MLT [Sciurus carolinensis]
MQEGAASLACLNLLWALMASTGLGTSMAQTVTQSQTEMSVQEAETTTLDCTYDTKDSNYYLFWYKQTPSGQMILIIRQGAYKQENATENRFSVNFQKAAKSLSLKISDSQLGDAAVYFCALMENTESAFSTEYSKQTLKSFDRRKHFPLIKGNKQITRISGEVVVEQNPQSLSSEEGEDHTIYCNYSVTSSDGLHWYRQDLGKSLEFLFVLLSNGAVKQEGRLTASLDTRARLSTLHIADTQYDLSATYFCALGTQCSHDTVNLHPNLQLVPQDPLLLGLCCEG